MRDAAVNEVVIVDAVRTPVGRRNGGLSTMHSAELLGVPLTALFERTGVDPAEVGQVVGGCVNQIGMQAFNIARTAWLSAGLPLEVAATTVDGSLPDSAASIAAPMPAAARGPSARGLPGPAVARPRISPAVVATTAREVVPPASTPTTS